jgi:hypothetical protein
VSPRSQILDEVESTVLEAVRTVQRRVLLLSLPPHLHTTASINAIATAAAKAARAETLQRLKEAD